MKSLLHEIDLMKRFTLKPLHTYYHDAMKPLMGTNTAVMHTYLEGDSVFDQQADFYIHSIEVLLQSLI